jgi:hypothetical protein
MMLYPLMSPILYRIVIQTDSRKKLVLGPVEFGRDVNSRHILFSAITVWWKSIYYFPLIVLLDVL